MQLGMLLVLVKGLPRDRIAGDLGYVRSDTTRFEARASGVDPPVRPSGHFHGRLPALGDPAGSPLRPRRRDRGPGGRYESGNLRDTDHPGFQGSAVTGGHPESVTNRILNFRPQVMIIHKLRIFI